MVNSYQLVEGIYLPAHDAHFAEQIRRGPLVDGKGTYQLAKLRAALSVSTRRGLAIDVGAQVGLWTRVLALEFERVIAIEPMPEHTDCLWKNTAGQLNVDLRSVALSDVPGRLSLRREHGVATARVCRDGEQADITVPACRLDDLDFVGVDFLKIDAEGFETTILCGGEKTIKRDRPVIVIEQKKRSAKYGQERLAGVNLLKSWGAKLEWSIAGDFCCSFGN